MAIFDNVNIDQRLVIGRDSSYLNGVILCRHILYTLTIMPFTFFYDFLKQNENGGKFQKQTSRFVLNMTS